MAFRGERFQVDLSPDEDALASQPSPAPTLPSFIKDVSERPHGTAGRPPTAPTPNPASTGFPAHKTRFTAASKFKQTRTDPLAASSLGKPQITQTQPTQNEKSRLSAVDRQEIDKENQQRLANMSDASIAKERHELMAGLNPSLIQRLLRRANIDETQNADFPQNADTPQQLTGPELNSTTDASGFEENDSSELSPPPSVLDILPPTSSTHFPPAPQPPSLDPSSPNFLTELHEKYFPNLAHDPSKLAWMKGSAEESKTSGQDQTQTYDPASHDLPIAALRFAFTGALLPPSTSQSIPVSKGLHHHGQAPDAAGYTVAELAFLARSQFPSQRCFAFQTLGRILYRLGIGEFGRLERGFQGDAEAEDEDAGLAKGLWDCVRDGRVLETLEEEAGREGGHVSAKAYAVEALWLWRKGGGTEVRAT